MEHIKLEVKKREKSGKQACKKIRKSGFVPAVVYGLEQDSVAVEVSAGDFEGARRAGGEHSVMDLEILTSGGTPEKVPVIVRGEQFHPVRGDILHIDFYRVSLTKEITSEIPLESFGEPEGHKFGGILEHSLRELEVKCLPDLLPEKIEIDVSTLNIGDSVHVKDLVAPEGVEILNDPEMIILSLIPPRLEEEEEEAEGAAETEEPEVITEKKEEEDQEGDKDKEKGKDKEKEKKKE
jgi:large subunit ribosomal protein L25